MQTTPDKDAAADLVWPCPAFQYRSLGQRTQSGGGPHTVGGLKRGLWPWLTTSPRSLLNILMERRRRRLEESGLPYEKRPPVLSGWNRALE